MSITLIKRLPLKIFVFTDFTYGIFEEFLKYISVNNNKYNHKNHLDSITGSDN